MRRENGSQKGYSLVEVLIGLALTAILAAGVYSLYTLFYRQTASQDLLLEAQQNARAAVERVQKEVALIGYRVPAGVDSITEADANAMEFRYTDPISGDRLRVRYTVLGDNSLAVRRCAEDASWTGCPDPNYNAIVPNMSGLTALQLRYFDGSGNELTAPVDAASIPGIRFIRVNITAATAREVGTTGSIETAEVSTEVRLRNFEVSGAAADTVGPSQPTGLESREATAGSRFGLCGSLRLRWDTGSDGDLAGYNIYYQLGTITGRKRVLLSELDDPGDGHYYYTLAPMNASGTDWDMWSTMSNAASATTYTIWIEAFDAAFNTSAISASINGDSDLNDNFAVVNNDTTINPSKPLPVSTFSAADGAADRQVALSWTYDLDNNPDVAGFRVYRSTSPFTDYPISTSDPNVEWIAGEPGSGKPEISKTATSYTDTSASLVGCRQYYYAIAPVSCDPSLISDDGGDPVAKKYVQTDYKATCGDGEDPCTPGTGFAAVSGSDTSPDESTAPAAPPEFAARAGWKRVAMTLRQPADTDLAQTCIYSRVGSSYPALLSTKDALGCFNPSDGIRMKESDGVLTTAEVAAGQSTSFWHNSMDSETSIPSLLETGTYSYTAVSFDLCGNASSASDAQATTTLCGEDPTGKPPAVSGLQASVCGGSPDSVALSWTGVSSNISIPSSATNPYDLAGYRVFRGDSTTINAASTAELTGGAPYWGTGSVTFGDSSVSDGGTYYYTVATTDCPYEKENPSSATVKCDMVDGSCSGLTEAIKWAQIGPVNPGQIERDERCQGAGSCSKDLHREVVSGVTVGATNTADPVSGFTHHTVTLFFENTSAGDMTITGATVSWVNSSAYLREISIGGGRSGVGATTTALDQSLTTAVSSSPYTKGVANVTLTSAEINGGEKYVPVTFTFKDSSGNPIDMRDDQLLVTLLVTNDSTSTTGCESYMTVSEDPEGVIVPFGPSITATQQNKPSSPTFGYAVPGPVSNPLPSGSDGTVVVDSGNSVTVSANVISNTTNAQTEQKVAISSATIYYKTTAKTVTTAPTSGFTAVAMSNVSGNVWSGTIPSLDGLRVWYYIVAKDADGNWDRDPEIAQGAYVYDQKNFNVCEVTPSAPTGLIATPSGTSVVLSWTAPTTYTSGATISGTDTIKYRVYRDGAQVGGDITGTTYTNTGLADGIYTYVVRAINSCTSPGPNVSANSTAAASCVGASSSAATLTVSPTTIYRGGSYTATVVDCYALRNDIIGYNGQPYGTYQQILNGPDGDFNIFKNTSSVGGGDFRPQVTETGAATATFTTTVTTTANSSESSTKLLVGATDTVTVFYQFASPQTRTVSVVTDPCTNTPKAPVIQAGSVSGQNLTVRWSAVTQNSDNSAISDLAGYNVYEKVCAKNKADCTGSDIVADWFLRTSASSGSTSVVVGADNGNINQRIYYFKVTAFDSCSTPREGAASETWNETD